MADYRLSVFAEAQVIDILADSEAQFGAAARQRYAALLVAAMQDVAEDPQRFGVAWPERLDRRIALYHLRSSRTRVPDPPGRVGAPRHLIVFRIGADGIVDVLGLMHERMLRGRALRRIVAANAAEE